MVSPTASGALTVARAVRPWWHGPAVVAGAAAAGVVLVLWRDPHVGGSLGFCPILALTGYACPGCGALRATDDLAHGRLAEAWSHNPLWVVAVPVLVLLWGRWVARSRRGMPLGRLRPVVPVVLFVVLVLFGVLRNLPALQPFLGP